MWTFLHSIVFNLKNPNQRLDRYADACDGKSPVNVGVGVGGDVGGKLQLEVCCMLSVAAKYPKGELC